VRHSLARPVPLPHARGVSAPPKPENQHYIPQFLLRQFGHGQGHGHVWVCDKATGRVMKRSVKRSASAPDFYAVNYPDRGRDVELEHVFGRLETIAAPLLKALAVLPPGAHDVGTEARGLLAGWLALSHSRVPSTIDSTMAMAKWTVAVETDMLLRNPERYRERARATGDTHSDAEIEAQRLVHLREHEDRNLVVEPAPETGLTALGMAVDHVRPILADMRWDIFRRGRFPWFVLGDQPVTTARPPDLSPLRGAGFATPGVEVYAPLSPEALLVGTHEPHDGSIRVFAPDERPGRPSFAHDWSLRPNLSAFGNAPGEVFGRSAGDLEAIRLSLAPEARTSHPQITVRGMPAEWIRYVPEGMVVETIDPPWTDEGSG
jgi:hypothetical protein